MIIYSVSDGISKAVPFLIFPLVAFYLSTEEFGLATNFTVLASAFGSIVGLSTNSALSVDYYRLKDKSESSLISNLTYLNLILFSLTLLFILIFNQQIEKWTNMGIIWQFLALTMSLFNAIAGLFTTSLQLKDRAKFFGIIQFVTSLNSALLTLFFVVLLRWSLQGRIYSMFISSFAICAIGAFFFTKQKLYFAKLEFNRIKTYIKFGLPLLPHNLSYWLKSGFEKLFISQSISLAENGIYSFAATISTMFFIFSNAFFGAYSPYLFRKLTDIENNIENKAEIKKSLVNNAYLFLAAFSIILILGYVFSSLLINLFFKDKYGGALLYLPFFLGFNLFNAIYSIFSGFIFFMKKTQYLGLITISTAFIQVFLMVVLVRHYGTVGAGIAMLTISIITAIMIAIYSNHIYPMPWLKKIKT